VVGNYFDLFAHFADCFLLFDKECYKSLDKQILPKERHCLYNYMIRILAVLKTFFIFL